MSLKRFAFLYLVVPFAFAVYLGYRGSIWVPELNTLESTALFVSIGLPFYLLAAALTYLSLPVVDYFRFRRFVALIAGAVFAIVIGYFYIIAYIIVMSAVFPGLERGLPDDGFALIDGFWGFLKGPTGVFFGPLWFGLHYIYEWGSGDVVFFPHLAKKRADRHPANTGVNVAPIFMRRVSQALRSNILAIEAREHYVIVHAEKGTEKVLYRFGDAVRELEAMDIGVRVHRSYWVAMQAIASLQREAKSMRLVLTNGMVVPVSHANSGTVNRLVDSLNIDDGHAQSDVDRGSIPAS